MGDKMEGMQADKFKSRMHSLAYGEAMAAAARDYKKEVQAERNAQPAAMREVDIDELLDDPELERLHSERIAALQKEAEKRVVLERKGHGEYQELHEGEFIEAVTNADKCVCHFFHRDFERCKLLDKHLQILARKHFGTRFIKLSAPDAPFFTIKLQVKVLPTLIMFAKGVAVERTVGFDDFGGKDDFTIAAVESKLRQAGMVPQPMVNSHNSDEDEPDAWKGPGNLRQSSHSRTRHTASDEDSDFD
ncbi:hypothetical protein WJX74_000424 [Apatococcus lobatus]|uniref:Thioredoxin domain-containing protein n=1 Tax=Apatococcus lobatus TaxID=904363 RepID=A0AAW1R1C5_9CHLO